MREREFKILRADEDYDEIESVILERVRINGGFVSAHAHFDRAFTFKKEDLKRLKEGTTVREKWQLVDEMKERSSVSDICSRMATAIELLMDQGCTAAGTFIDIDPVMRDKSIKATQLVRDQYPEFDLVVMNQCLKGVLNKEALEWFELGAQFVDIIGALPAKDDPHQDEHLDVVMQTAKRMGKMVHVHVDQENRPSEKETELLIGKTRQYRMEGKVVGIHGLSISAQPLSYRLQIYQQLRDLGISFISCPSAWFDAERRDNEWAPIHNPVTPVDEMYKYIRIAVGIDNLRDLYKPSTTGSMLREVDILHNLARFFGLREIADMASINGRIVLGLEENPVVLSRVA